MIRNFSGSQGDILGSCARSSSMQRNRWMFIAGCMFQSILPPYIPVCSSNKKRNSLRSIRGASAGAVLFRNYSHIGGRRLA